jgi:hypothetical protein
MNSIQLENTIMYRRILGADDKQVENLRKLKTMCDKCEHNCKPNDVCEILRKKLN